MSEECDIGLRGLSSLRGSKREFRDHLSPSLGQSGSGWELGGEPKPGLVVGKTGVRVGGSHCMNEKVVVGWEPSLGERGVCVRGQHYGALKAK